FVGEQQLLPDFPQGKRNDVNGKTGRSSPGGELLFEPVPAFFTVRRDDGEERNVLIRGGGAVSRSCGQGGDCRQENGQRGKEPLHAGEFTGQPVPAGEP